MQTVKIKITRATVCGGKHVAVGDVVSASENDARVLMAMGKAVPAGKQVKEEKPE